MSVLVQKRAIGQLCELVRGTSPTLKTEPGKYPFVVTAAFRRTSSDWQIEGPAVCVPLVSSTGHGDAALHRVHFQHGKFALANLLVALIPRDPTICDAKYLYYLLQAQKDSLFVPLMLGTANVSLKERDIASVEVPLPPLAEQRRIVACIEALAAKVEEAHTARKESQRELSVLTSSFANAVFDKADIQTRPLSDVCLLITDGTHQTPRYVEDGAIFLSAQNVKPFRFMPEVHRKVSHEDFAGYTARNKPTRGDVLLTRVGAGIGEAAVVDQDIEFAIYVSVALIRPNSKVLMPEYLVQWLNSPIGRSFSRANTLGRGHSQGNLNLNLLRAFPIPIPALEKQRRVVAALDAMRVKIDVVSALHSETAAELDAMLPAILDKAFKGDL